MATHCGLSIPDGSHFCPVCGEPLPAKGDGAGGDVITVAGISQSSGLAIGRGAQATVHQSGIDANALELLFAPVCQQVRDRPNSAAIDQTELLHLVKLVEAEAKKGETANSSKLERWLKTLAEVAPDILKSVVTVLSASHSAVLGTIAKLFGS